ncbi:hypothetical protein D3C73_1418580 [compost metagenome]
MVLTCGAVAGAENFVGLYSGFPLFLGLAVAQVGIDPRNEGAGQGHAKLGGVNAGALGREDLVVDLENGGRGIVQFAADLVVEGAELVEEFTHVPGPAT